MTTKQALDEAMSQAAAHCWYVRAVQALAAEVSDNRFFHVAGLEKSTLGRCFANATSDFQRLKAAYEEHCREIKEPAYATWNED